MNIEKLTVIGDGYVQCGSCFYSALDILSEEQEYNFSVGNNVLNGDIDSGIWAISYLISMYAHKQSNFTLFQTPKCILNNAFVTIDDISMHACYMDISYPLFSKNVSIKKVISDCLKKSNNVHSSLIDIKDMFEIDNERFERPLSQVGNERFRAMAAIGYAIGKDIFCFPWMSQNRFESFHSNIVGILPILESLNKIVILPIGKK